MHENGRPHRRFDDLMTFVIGLIVGGLTMFAAESGRLATIETTMSVHSAALASLQTDLKEIHAQLETVQTSLVQLNRRHD